MCSCFIAITHAYARALAHFGSGMREQLIYCDGFPQLPSSACTCWHMSNIYRLHMCD